MHVDIWSGSARQLLEDREFRWGVDLYNQGYYWEAHEAWEALWKIANKQSTSRLLLQGLIQCSGAVLKALVGEHEGCSRLGTRGLEKIEGAIHEPCFSALRLESFQLRFQEFLADQNHSAEPPKISIET